MEEYVQLYVQLNHDWTTGSVLLFGFRVWILWPSLIRS